MSRGFASWRWPAAAPGPAVLRPALTSHSCQTSCHKSSPKPHTSVTLQFSGQLSGPERGPERGRLHASGRPRGSKVCACVFRAISSCSPQHCSPHCLGLCDLRAILSCRLGLLATSFSLAQGFLRPCLSPSAGSCRRLLEPCDWTGPQGQSR